MIALLKKKQQQQQKKTKQKTKHNVDLPIRLKGILKRISWNSLSLPFS